MDGMQKCLYCFLKVVLVLLLVKYTTAQTLSSNCVALNAEV